MPETSLTNEEFEKLRAAVEQNVQEAAALSPGKSLEASVEIKRRVVLRAFAFARRKGIVIADQNTGRLFRLTRGAKLLENFPLDLLYRKLSDLNGLINIAKVRLQTALSRERGQTTEGFASPSPMPIDSKKLH